MLPGFCLLARKSGATIVPAAIDGAFAALPRGSALVRPHQIKLAFDAALTPSQYEQLTDAELTQIVANRIERTFQRLQRDEVERQIAVDSAAKPANRLLASSRERALTTEKSI
jgi:1-acyl-sn-glycerol-3-phosphate acyltransferase